MIDRVELIGIVVVIEPEQVSQLPIMKKGEINTNVECCSCDRRAVVRDRQNPIDG